MGDQKSIEELVEASSLGTPAAKAARESVSPEVAARIVARAARLAEIAAKRPEVGAEEENDG